MADDKSDDKPADLMEHMAAMARSWAAEIRAPNPLQLVDDSEPVKTIAQITEIEQQMYRDLEDADLDALLFESEESPAAREVCRRRIAGYIFGRL